MAKTCKNCGNLFEDELSICPRCGTQYIEDRPQATGYDAGCQQPQQNYQQPYYQQPYYRQPVQPQQSEMSTGSWLGTIILTTCFGIVSIILLFVWGFGSTTPDAKKKYCRAMLIYNAICIGLVILMLILISVVVVANGDSILDSLEEFFDSYSSYSSYGGEDFHF